MSELVPILPVAWEPQGFTGSMRRIVQRQFPYPDYPTAAKRLVVPETDFQFDTDGRLVMPYEPRAPWLISNNPARVNAMEKHMPSGAYVDTGDSLDAAVSEQLVWNEESGRLGKADARGLPLHPHAYDMLTHSLVGAVVSAGSHRRLGPNKMAHTVIFSPQRRGKLEDLRVLLELRNDSCSYGIP
jgi:hypothetical protein